jgi:hypothetical protein
MRCPVCKADNSLAPTCRRCKADLVLLWDLEARRDALLASARRQLQQGNWLAATTEAHSAAALRRGLDAAQLGAVARLLARNFDGALSTYRRAQAELEADLLQDGSLPE